MKNATIIAMLLLLAAAPAAAQKVNIDYDKETDFTRFETFSWKATPEVSLADTSPLMHSRIKNAIEHQLTQRGLIEDPEDPDLYVTYYTEEKTEYRVHTSSYGYNHGRSWYRRGQAGMSSSTSTVSTFPKGTLVIDIWDARENKAVWRATTEALVPSNPEKAARKIDQAIEKIANRWDKMYQPGR